MGTTREFFDEWDKFSQLYPGPGEKFLLKMPLYNLISGHGYNDEFFIFFKLKWRFLGCCKKIT